MFRISVGFGCILVIVLFAALALGLVPDQERAVRHGRKNLAEAMAIQCTLAAQRHDVSEMEAVVKSICQRNPDILSAAIRKADGKLLIHFGPHDAPDSAQGVNASDACLHVPITIKNQRWGALE